MVASRLYSIVHRLKVPTLKGASALERLRHFSKAQM